MQTNTSSQMVDRHGLKRALTLPLVVLYGLGVTIGAGIYVLVGATAQAAGVYAPWAFGVAALVMLPSACAFAELVGRLPVSAGEAAYVRHGYRRDDIALIVGLMVVTVGTVSAAAICAGSVGYIREFIAAPPALLIPIVAIAMGLVAAIGVKESVMFAAVMTVIEIAGLVAVVLGGLVMEPVVAASAVSDAVATTGAPSPWLGVLGASVIAFFAFVGFEDLVNMAEETKAPERTLPRAIFITLALSTTLYILVSWVAVRAVPIDDLAASQAPLSLVFERATGLPPAAITAIAIIATLNGVIVQIIMAARVLYGLSHQGQLPAFLGAVHPLTRTPVTGTGLVTGLVLALALLAPMQTLAEATSTITLTIFALVNGALIGIKWRGEPAPPGTFVVPLWLPFAGIASCALLITVSLL